MFFRRIIKRTIIHPDKAKIIFKEGQTVRVMGRPFTIKVSIDESSTYSTARVKDGEVKIKLMDELKPQEQQEMVSSLCRKAITRAILPVLNEHVRELNGKYFQSELGAIRLKDNVSNWGSCSRDNNINLDFRLLLGPEDILDAVILHELTHTKHRDHSKNFYDTLLAIMPNNKEKLRWLRDNGSKLHTEAQWQNNAVPTGEQQAPQAPMPDVPIWRIS